MNIENQHEFKLIEGQFSPSDANTILLSLFNSKINYHTLESFSNHIRHGSDLENSRKRVQNLQDSIEKIKILIEEAISSGKKIKMESSVTITFVD